MLIREYDSGDLDDCRTLWAEMVGRHREIYGDPSIGGEEPGLEFDAHLNRVGAGRIWVCVIDGEIKGMAGLIAEGPEAEVEPVIVKTDCRGSGVGRALVERAVEGASEAGAAIACVRPVARNLEAIEFFHKAGFRKLGHVQMFMELGEPAPTGYWKPGAEFFGHTFEY